MEEVDTVCIGSVSGDVGCGQRFVGWTQDEGLRDLRSSNLWLGCGHREVVSIFKFLLEGV